MHPGTVLRFTPLRSRRALLRIELLDERALPSTTAEPFFPTVMAGDSKGLPPDTPTQRVDPNSASSPFAGVGSLVVGTGNTERLGSGAAIGSRYVLTAAHVVDLNNDGKFDGKDGTSGIYFVLNIGGDATHRIAVAQVDIHPFFTGFNRPTVNDDIAVLTLAEDLPEGVPTYAVGGNLVAGTIITFVGYGRSGEGLKGYTTAASPVVKRFGQNVVDAFYGQDDKGQPEVNEVYRFDFDGPKGKGPLGAGTLGNSIESQLGTGDSGGPAFVLTDYGYTIVGVSSFVQGSNAPRFGSMGGGAIVTPYLSFIHSIIGTSLGGEEDPGDGSGSGVLDPDLTVKADGSYIPFFGPAFIPSKGRVRVKAKAVSGEFAILQQPLVPSDFGKSTGFGTPSFGSLTIDRQDETILSTDSKDLSDGFVRRIDDPLLHAADPTTVGSPGGLDFGSTSFLSFEGILADE